MPTINDPTGYESTEDVAGVVWTKTEYSSYTNYRSADGRFFVGQGFSRYWHLSVRNAAGEFDTRSRRPEVFTKPEQALLFAALMVTAEEAAA